MAHNSDQGAVAVYSSGPSGDVADPPEAPVAASSVMTVGSSLTVAGILTVFMLFALALVLFQYCVDDAEAGRRRRGVRTVAGRGGSARTRGVDPEVLRSLPVTVYRATAGPKEDAVECAVCLAELEDGEEARFLPRCGHGFHVECVDMWLASHSTCPLCRLTVAKPDVPLAPSLALTLPTVLPEPANYAANLPASLLLENSHQVAVTAATSSTDRDRSPSTGTTALVVIEIPESAAPTPRDAAKSPGSARLRSIRRLWSFGRQGAGPSSAFSCAGAEEGADVEQGISVTIGIAVAEAPLPSETAVGAIRGAAA
ncbi:E3 ubiquitin-protein ligase EL5-like [Phragmites australis]|uniref:E3 ubiquitin-protein ligase EL5-like n=1 Tax=Phragmites australis TaxID=29695 RepID=UPI002D7992C4|nr:E3 ubiquitin-protein ligase EL5-like [Phragmites australis]